MAATVRGVVGWRRGCGLGRVAATGVLAASLGAHGAGSALSDGTTAVLSLTGDVATAGGQTFTGFGIGAPAINAQGRAAFMANLSGNGVNTPSAGIFVGSGGTVLLLLPGRRRKSRQFQPPRNRLRVVTSAGATGPAPPVPAPRPAPAQTGLRLQVEGRARSGGARTSA